MTVVVFFNNKKNVLSPGQQFSELSPIEDWIDSKY